MSSSVSSYGCGREECFFMLLVVFFVLHDIPLVRRDCQCNLQDPRKPDHHSNPVDPLDVMANALSSIVISVR